MPSAPAVRGGDAYSEWIDVDTGPAAGGSHCPTATQESGVLVMSQTETSTTVDHPAGAAPYWNPYLAGLFLGMTLLISFLTLGAGLGASAAPARFGAVLMRWIAPAHTMASEYFGPWFAEGANPLSYYLVFMFAGVLLGGFFSAIAARRLHLTVEKGASASPQLRLTCALIGGVLVGFSSRLASGCTSGQALTGGALLANGSIVFVICVFVGGYATAWFVRRQWND